MKGFRYNLPATELEMQIDLSKSYWSINQPTFEKSKSVTQIQLIGRMNQYLPWLKFQNQIWVSTFHTLMEVNSIISGTNKAGLENSPEIICQVVLTVRKVYIELNILSLLLSQSDLVVAWPSQCQGCRQDNHWRKGDREICCLLHPYHELCHSCPIKAQQL